jgi:hypothetical protein
LLFIFSSSLFFLSSFAFLLLFCLNDSMAQPSYLI